jgi:hypothetical protein
MMAAMRMGIPFREVLKPEGRVKKTVRDVKKGERSSGLMERPKLNKPNPFLPPPRKTAQMPAKTRKT